MNWTLTRRDVMRSVIAGSALCAGCANRRGFFWSEAAASPPTPRGLVSPGCRGSKVRVAKIYLANPAGGLWPTPKLDLNAEIARYEAELTKMSKELADVDFVAAPPAQKNTPVTSAEQARQAKESLAGVDGVLIIHLSMGVAPMLQELLAANKPTMLFAAPYSGHEWTGFGALTRSKKGAQLDCLLTSDTSQLAVAIRPIRAIHHLREAKILNVTSRPWPAARLNPLMEKFGTSVEVIGRERMMKAYEAIPESVARAEAEQWIRGATAVVEPSRDEVMRSCRLALAFEKLMDEENGTVITTDCYGTMYHQLPAFPCVGNVRLNNMGLGGICESDLSCAMTHIIFQGLVGRPGFISDPTMDISQDSIILAHCLGSMKMDGPAGPAAPYKLRSIMERQEGCVPEVRMRVGQKVTQAILVDADNLRYFTGGIIDTPETERGCRTKITVKIDGDSRKLWLNWSHGLHRVTCYGDVREDLRRLCKFKNITMIDETA